MLFTGDIEQKTEDVLVKEKDTLKSDILKIAHHRFKDIYYKRFCKIC